MAQAKTSYDMTVHPTSALVRSQSNGAAAHAVTLPSCDCPDFINRRGRLVEVQGGIAVTLCKHIEAALLRVGGWNREPEPGPAVTNYPGLTRSQAMTVLTSHFINAGLANRLLLAACGAEGMVVAEPITTGEMRATYDSVGRRYTLQLPASQPGE
jgi:hypothetical protein